MVRLKNVLLLGLLVFVSQVHADFIVIQRSASPYSLKSEAVYDLTIISSETQTVAIKLFGTVRKDGKEVVQLESRPVMINPGANTLSSFNVSSQRKNYLNKNILEIEQLTTSLPPGNYELCVYLRCATADCSGLGRTPFDAEAVYCQQVKVEPPTPLMLSYPEDGAKLKIKKPTLSYIPPGPIAASSKLNYTITLVKLNKGQNKLDGIKRNRPLMRKTGHSLTSLMYPLDLADLEVGEKYAWQVEAWVGDQWISTSEVWEFEVEEEEEQRDTFKYAMLKEKETTSYYTLNGNTILFFTHKGLYNNQLLRINLLDDLGTVVKKTPNAKKAEVTRPNDDTLVLQSFGDNKYKIDLARYQLVQGFYSLKIWDGTNKIYYLKFYIKD